MLPLIVSAQLIGGQSQSRNEMMYQCQNLLRTTANKWVVLICSINLCPYIFHIKLKKWWWPFFAWEVKTSMTNAWNLFGTVPKKKIGMSESQREAAMTILISFGKNKPAKSLVFPRNVGRNVKLDTKNHIHHIKILLL